MNKTAIYFLILFSAALFIVAGIAPAAARTIGGSEDSSLILTLSANSLELPGKIDLFVNLKEATDMELKIPFDLLTTATRVVQ